MIEKSFSFTKPLYPAHIVTLKPSIKMINMLSEIIGTPIALNKVEPIYLIIIGLHIF